MKKTNLKARSIAAVAMAAMIAGSITATTVSADYGSSYSYSSSSSVYKIPQTIYMTVYSSGTSSRQAKVDAVVNAAKTLLSQIKYTEINAVQPTFDGITTVVGTTKYDHLIKANASSSQTVLTFNSESNLKAGMSKIKAEEQAIMNAALLPYRNYVDNLISSGTYTDASNETDADKKTAKIFNGIVLQSLKEQLTYTYSDLDLFSGDVTGTTKTYQVGYLVQSSVGDSQMQTVVANDEEFTRFPKLIIGGSEKEWDEVHHLDIFNNSNSSWWFALRDGNTLNNDYYWLNGMMIPDFESTISFDAYAGSYWAQYGAMSTGTSSSGSSNNSSSNGSLSGGAYTLNGMYYNPSYNYVSDNIYGITNGTNIFYYPNSDYARAAMSYYDNYYIFNVTPSTHSSAASYFCFINGSYYASAAQSPYPSYTYQMRTSSTGGYYDTYNSLNYYLSNGYVYDSNGSQIGSAASRGYSSYATWFNATDGKFYSSPQSNAKGYYASGSGVSTNTTNYDDPYYQYFMYRMLMLQQQQNAANNNASSSNKTTTSSSSSSSSSQTNDDKDEITADSENESFVSAQTLAALRASGDTIKVKGNNSTYFTISGENVTTPRDINFRVTFGEENIPEKLRKAAIKENDAVAISNITIGENVKWSSTASLTIKYNEKRANFIARLYYYDTSDGTLNLVNTATVGNTGYVTFNNLNHGGDYYVTLA